MFTIYVVNDVVDEEIFITNFGVFLNLSVNIIFCIDIMVPSGPQALCKMMGRQIRRQFLLHPYSVPNQASQKRSVCICICMPMYACLLGRENRKQYQSITNTCYIIVLQLSDLKRQLRKHCSQFPDSCKNNPCLSPRAESAYVVTRLLILSASSC